MGRFPVNTYVAKVWSNSLPEYFYPKINNINNILTKNKFSLSQTLET